jgi:predicted homoserine dehydrogenase-like protein
MLAPKKEVNEVKEIRVAIVGLGRVGSKFLKKLAGMGDQGIKIVAVAERDEDLPGVEFAKKRGITVYSDGKEVIEMGDAVDVIFDLTGDPYAKMELRIMRSKSGSYSTAIAHEALALLTWYLIADDEELHLDNPD